MKKLFNNLITKIVISLILCSSLAACGGGGTNDSQNRNGSAQINPSSGLTALPTGSNCNEQTINSCSGHACLILQDNDQGMSGMCSKSCTADSSCGSGERCVDLGQEVGGSFCLETCQTNQDCHDEFICVIESGQGFCHVTLNHPIADLPINNSSSSGSNTGTSNNTNPTNSSINNSCEGCAVYTDARVAGYCGNLPNATKVCDCYSGATPGSSCVAATSGAGLFCCP